MPKKNDSKICMTCGVVSSHAARSHWQMWWLVAAALVVALMLAACGASSSPTGELAQDQQTLSTCDPAAPPAAFVDIDGTGSSASDAIAAERMKAVESIVRRTAICSGDLRVVVFSASSVATTTLFDGPLRLAGATDNARLKRVSGLVQDVMTTIRKAYGPAVAALPNTGSDVIGQYALASEWAAQVGGNFRLHLDLLSDGLQNVRVNLGAQVLSKQEATALAQQVTMPKLPGATVVVAGLGRVASGPPSSDLVAGLVEYYNSLCEQSGAAKCISVTDYATEGR